MSRFGEDGLVNNKFTYLSKISILIKLNRGKPIFNAVGCDDGKFYHA
jgi:hypothetical protein